MKRYDAFISYSHKADARVAKQLELGLKNMGRQWNQLRALEVFRDEASLSASTDLWKTISKQLDSVDYTIVLLSPEAVESPWVGREIDHFLKSDDDEHRLLLALTAGELSWDPAAKDWTAQSTAVPAELRGRLVDEPLWVDLRWTRAAVDLRWRDPVLRSAVATLAAPIHGKSKDELEGEDLRAHRKFVRIRRFAIAAMVLLVAAASWQTNMAVAANRQSAEERTLRREVEVVNSELDAANDDLEAANVELELTNGQLDTANKDLDTANKDLEAANTDLDTANTNLEAVNGQLEVVNVELELTNGQLELTNGQLDIANKDLEAANTNLEAANVELELTNGQLDTANKDLDTANAELRLTNRRLAELEKFARESAGTAICNKAIRDYDLGEFQLYRDQIDRWTLQELSPWRGEFDELMDLPDTTLEDVRQWRGRFPLISWLIAPEFGPDAYGDPKPCSEIAGFPFTDDWSSIGDPILSYMELNAMPSCLEIRESYGDADSETCGFDPGEINWLQPPPVGDW